MSGVRPALTVAQVAALADFAVRHGRCWKDALRQCWMSGAYGDRDDSASLQQVRNTHGPSWLVRYRPAVRVLVVWERDNGRAE